MEPLRSPMHKFALRTRAFNLIKERSFARGEFTLASGKKSDYYLDLKPTMFHPEGALVLAELIMDRLTDVPVDYVGGLEMGAVPLISTLTMLSFYRPRQLPGFFVRKAVKDHGTKRKIESAGDIRGKNVVILDDVTTSGESAMEAVMAARDAGANVLMVLSVVDREEGAAAFYKKKEIEFRALFTAGDFLNSAD